MNDELKKGPVSEIAEQLGGIYRHLLPGVLVFVAACVSQQDLFAQLIKTWEYLFVWAVVAIAVGNVVYVLARYGLHQLIDWILYYLDSPSPAHKDGKGCYIEDLSDYIVKSLNVNTAQRARDHISFRASAIVVLETVTMLSVLVLIFHSPCSLVGDHRLFVEVLGLLALIIAFIQQSITRRVDGKLIGSSGVK